MTYKNTDRSSGDEQVKESLRYVKSVVLPDLLHLLFHKTNNKLGVALANMDIIRMEQKRNGVVSDGIVEDSTQALKEMHSMIRTFSFLVEGDSGNASESEASGYLLRLGELSKAGVMKNCEISVASSDVCLNPDRERMFAFILLMMISHLRSSLRPKGKINISLEAESGGLRAKISGDFLDGAIGEYKRVLVSSDKSDPDFMHFRVLLDAVYGKIELEKTDDSFSALVITVPARGK